MCATCYLFQVNVDNEMDAYTVKGKHLYEFIYVYFVKFLLGFGYPGRDHRQGGEGFFFRDKKTVTKRFFFSRKYFEKNKWGRRLFSNETGGKDKFSQNPA